MWTFGSGVTQGREEKIVSNVGAHESVVTMLKVLATQAGVWATGAWLFDANQKYKIESKTPDMLSVARLPRSPHGKPMLTRVPV